MEENESPSRSNLAYAGVGFGLAALIGVYTLGPIDSARTAYNAIVGDVPFIRSRAVEYCRKNIQSENPSYDEGQVEERLADDLNYSLGSGGLVNPQEVRMMELWDAVEDHASDWFDRWIWSAF